MSKIFERQRLTAAQLRQVADRRYDDAEFLRQSGINARANGVFYLAGFVVECLLKARLVEAYPSVVAERDPGKLSRSDRLTWALIFRSHELDQMLERLPDIEVKMRAANRMGGDVALASLKKICGEWTIFARYSTRVETMKAASVFLDQIKELRSWLKH